VVLLLVLSVLICCLFFVYDYYVSFCVYIIICKCDPRCVSGGVVLLFFMFHVLFFFRLCMQFLVLFCVFDCLLLFVCVSYLVVFRDCYVCVLCVVVFVLLVCLLTCFCSIVLLLLLCLFCIRRFKYVVCSFICLCLLCCCCCLVFVLLS